MPLRERPPGSRRDLGDRVGSDPAAAADDAGAGREPRIHAGSQAARGALSGSPGPGPSGGVPALAAIRIDHDRLRGPPGGPSYELLDMDRLGAVDPDGDDPRRMLGKVERLLDRVTPPRMGAVGTAEAPPSSDVAPLVEELGQRPPFVDRGDRLQGEQVGAARCEHVQAGTMEIAQLGDAQAVVTAVLRAI